VTVLFTIDHGAVSAEEFLQRCDAAGLAAIVDVRTLPGSRRHPHFRKAEMERWLGEVGIAYGWEPRLGGLRKPRADSENDGLRNAAFRGYADHMQTREFVDALHAVLAGAAQHPMAVMCAETLWWRCHRRLIADAAVLLFGAEVRHLFGGDRSPHRLTDSATVAAGRLVYEDVSAARLPR
jgi:uncharacterized protein (DUF488 family)